MALKFVMFWMVVEDAIYFEQVVYVCTTIAS